VSGRAGSSVNALAELRQRATREGHCFQHVQAITVAIDQYVRRQTIENALRADQAKLITAE
jgi:hypothetical protein